MSKLWRSEAYLGTAASEYANTRYGLALNPSTGENLVTNAALGKEQPYSFNPSSAIVLLIMTVPEARKYKPGAYISDRRLPHDVVEPDLLILNQPIADFGAFSRIWRHTCYRICADGGANRLYDMFQGALEKCREDYVRFLPRGSGVSAAHKRPVARPHSW